MQLSLLEPAQAITKTIKNIPLSSLELSPFNPRSTRPDDHTDKLAGRIARQGFEVTRALWVYPSGDKFLVFAGGTRLKAAIIAKLAEVPCVVHEGLTEADIVRLAYQDNENDEYHAPVSIVDVWANYAALAWQGWTQKQIGDAVGTDQATVSRRLKYNLLDPLVKRFMEQDSISEGHLKEFDLIWNVPYLDGWLDKNTAMLELCQIAAKDKLTVRDTKKIVEQWKAFIDLATKSHDALPEQWQAQLISALATNKARSIKEVQRAIDGVNIAKAKADKAEAKRLADELAEKLSEAEKSENEIKLAEQRAQIEAIKFGDTCEIQSNNAFVTLICGKAEDVPQIADNSIDLIITSPPYNFGGDYWPMGGGGRNPREDGIGYADDMPYPDYFDWQIKVLIEMYRVAKEGASMFYNHKVRQMDGGIIHPLKWLMRDDSPWTIRQEIIWDRKSTHNHVPSLFWQHDERIFWLTKGKPIIPNQPIGLPSIWPEFGPIPNQTSHPAPFTPKLPRMILEIFIQPNMTVLDPFVGSGTVIDVCNEMGINSIGVDISENYIKSIGERYV